MKRSYKVLFGSILIVVGSLFIMAVGTQAQSTNNTFLSLRVGDVFAYPGQQQLPIPVYLANYVDTVAAFSLLLMPYPTNLTSLNLEIDTTGSLIAGWPVVQSIFVGVNVPAIQVVAEYRTLPFTGTEEPLYPQGGETPAFWIYVDVATIPDTASIRECLIYVDFGMIHFGLESKYGIWDIHGNPVGLRWEYYIDTSYYACKAWDPLDENNCLEWEQVSGPPYDSIYVLNDSNLYIDTNVVIVEPGTLTIAKVRCGNFDNSADNKINLADITAMIAYVYLNGDEPAVPWASNVDGSLDGKVNLADITSLIGHVYLGTGPLACE